MNTLYKLINNLIKQTTTILKLITNKFHCNTTKTPKHIFIILITIFSALNINIANADTNNSKSLSNLNASGSITIKEGVDYTLLNNLTVPVTQNQNSSKVEVKEFFSFTCIHCKELEPLVETSLLKHQSINFNKIHVVWDDSSASLGRLNATLQELKLNNLYIPFFTAVFAQQDISNLNSITKILQTNHFNKQQIDNFVNVYNSFSINAKVNEYKEFTKNYNIMATPTFIVGDYYVVKPATPDRLIKVVLELVKKYQTLKTTK